MRSQEKKTRPESAAPQQQPAPAGGERRAEVPAGRAGRPVTLALGVLLAVYFILGGLYLATVPFGNAPDENEHLLYVQQLAQGKLPVLHEGDRANFEAHQPPLAYALALPAYLAAGGRGSGPTTAARVAVRLVDLLLGAVVVLLVFAGMRMWLPANPWAGLAAAAVAALMPMRLAVNSSFSNDPLTEVIFCAVLLVLTLGLRDGFDRRRCLQAGALIGLGLLTKTTCALLLPVALLALFLEWRRHQARGREYALNALLLAGAVLLLGGPWLVRNVVLYGDPLAMKVFATFFADRATPEYFRQRQGLTFDEYLRYRVLAMTARSFWGVFGHMNVWLGGPMEPRPGLRPDIALRGDPDAPIYAELSWAAYLLAAGAVVAAARWLLGRPARWQREVAVVWGLAAVMVASAFLRFNMQFFQAQARYLYPAVLPIAAAMAAGWLVPWPRQWRPAGAALMMLALAALAVVAWQGTLLRVFGKVGW